MKKHVVLTAVALVLLFGPVANAYAYVSVLRPDAEVSEITDPEGWPEWIGY